MPMRLRKPEGEGGFTLVAVMGTMAVLSTILIATLAFSVNNLAPSRKNQDAQAALAAAQAGVDEYVARLNANDVYWTNDGIDSGNPAYASTAGPGATIQGTGTVGARYKYQLLSTSAQTARTQIIRLKVTGTSANGKASRQLVAQLSPASTSKYVYFTDVEATDPALYDDQATGYAYRLNGNYAGTVRADRNRVDEDCSKYYYAGRATPSYRAVYSGTIYNIKDYCSNIQWVDGDVVAGDLHTNDSLQIVGSPTYGGTRTESSWPRTGTPPAPTNGRLWWGGGTPDTNRPVFALPQKLPETNAQIKTFADPSMAGSDGCLYYGATRIRFDGDKMKVLSPGTRASNTPLRCLNVGSRNSEQTLAIPPVIYVEDASSCSAGASSGVGYPAYNEDTTVGTTTDYGCLNGTAYVQGRINGQVNIASKADVVITGDLTYQDGVSGDDVVGLTPNNYVWIYNPVRSSGAALLTNRMDQVHNVNAAILAVRHSFLVQNWNTGGFLSSDGTDASKLNITGSIAQAFRGPVGSTNGSNQYGYLKNYVYDDRLQVLRPPYFLRPTTSPWEASQLTD